MYCITTSSNSVQTVTVHDFGLSVCVTYKAALYQYILPQGNLLRLSLFTQPHAGLILYGTLSSVDNKTKSVKEFLQSCLAYNESGWGPGVVKLKKGQKET